MTKKLALSEKVSPKKKVKVLRDDSGLYLTPYYEWRPVN